MDLYIIRHAWAEDHDERHYPEDALRPLTREGRQRFELMVRELAERGFEPEIIATSPLLRCRQTAEIIARHVKSRPKVVELDALQPSSDLAALSTWTARQPDLDVAWVGHAPDVGHLTAAILDGNPASFRFPKGAIASIRFEDGFQPRRGELHWFATAKLLGC